MSGYNNLQYPIRDIYSHLEEGSKSSDYSEGTSSFRSSDPDTKRRPTWPLTPPLMHSPDTTQDSGTLPASPLELDASEEEAMPYYISSGRNTPDFDYGSKLPLPHKRASSHPRSRLSPSIGEEGPHSLPTNPQIPHFPSSKHSRLPRLVTQLDSPSTSPETLFDGDDRWKHMYRPSVRRDISPCGEYDLGSKWSPDSAVESMEYWPSHELEEGNISNVSYDSETTLELETGDESDGEFSGGDDNDDRVAGGLELRAPGSRAGLTRTLKYTHGHALQRMPGKVKGFGQVPHYHHKVHGGEFEFEEEEEESSESSSGSDEEEEEGLIEKGVAFSDLRGNHDSPDTGLAFLNLNLTETGRDVRVLVRSKQTTVNELGGSIEDFEKIIEELIVEEPMLFEDTDDAYHRKLIMHPRDSPKFMIKRLPLSSVELLVLLELNQPDVRNAAWNPVPHVICAVDRPRTTQSSMRDVEGGLGKDDDDVFLFFEPLQEAKNNPWLQTVADYLDCFKQLLEGLTFLHEHRIAGLRCSLTRSFMRTSEPSAPSFSSGSGYSTPDHPKQILYKLVDFAESQRISPPQSPITCRERRASRLSWFPTVPATSLGGGEQDVATRDVQDLAIVFRRILDQRIPQVQAWFNPLVEAMSRGGIAANEARLLLAQLTGNLGIMAAEEAEGVKGEEGRGAMAGVLESRARPEPSPVEGSVKTQEGGMDMVTRRSSSHSSSGPVDEDEDLRHARYYHKSGEASDDPNDCEGQEEEQEQGFGGDCHGDGGSGRGRSGTVMVKSTIPRPRNAMYVDIVPEH